MCIINHIMSTPRKNIPDVIRNRVLEFYGYRCANYPGANLEGIGNYKCHLYKGDGKGFFDEANYHIDHITPLHRSGSNDISNLQALCPSCHSVKTGNENKTRVRVKKETDEEYKNEDTESDEDIDIKKEHKSETSPNKHKMMLRSHVNPKLKENLHDVKKLTKWLKKKSDDKTVMTKDDLDYCKQLKMLENIFGKIPICNQVEYVYTNRNSNQHLWHEFSYTRTIDTLKSLSPELLFEVCDVSSTCDRKMILKVIKEHKLVFLKSLTKVLGKLRKPALVSLCKDNGFKIKDMTKSELVNCLLFNYAL